MENINLYETNVFGANSALRRHLQKSCDIHKMTTMSKKKQERISVYRATRLRHYNSVGLGQHDDVGYAYDWNTKLSCTLQYYYIIFTWPYDEKLK